MIKFCQQCYEKKEKLCLTGYSWGWKDELVICPHCGGEMDNIDFPYEDLKILLEISETKDFIEAMIELREKDLVEYQLKMSQFKANLMQQKVAVEKNDTSKQVKCPRCGSTNIQVLRRMYGEYASFEVDRVCVNCKHQF